MGPEISTLNILRLTIMLKEEDFYSINRLTNLLNAKIG